MFLDLFNQFDFRSSISEVKSKTKLEVEIALSKAVNGERLEFIDYLSLISPNANFYLEEMATLSKAFRKNNSALYANVSLE